MNSKTEMKEREDDEGKESKKDIPEMHRDSLHDESNVVSTNGQQLYDTSSHDAGYCLVNDTEKQTCSVDLKFYAVLHEQMFNLILYRFSKRKCPIMLAINNFSNNFSTMDTII